MKLSYKVTLLVLFLANIGLAAFAFTNWSTNKTNTHSIPITEFSRNELIKSRLQLLTEKSSDNQAVVALLGSKSTFCVRGKVVKLLKEVQKKSRNSSLSIILPEETTDQEVANFKSNLDIDFEVIKADKDLNNFWQPLSEKYNATGVVIIARAQDIFVSQSLTEIKKQFAIK
ncbi:MAG: hypothetical protein ACK5NT_02540 [Pyrinomonadaceae bacterium]